MSIYWGKIPNKKIKRNDIFNECRTNICVALLRSLAFDFKKAKIGGKNDSTFA